MARADAPLQEYIETTLTDVKTCINSMNAPEDDKKHLLDTIWLLANSAKDGNDWTVDLGFSRNKK